MTLGPDAGNSLGNLQVPGLPHASPLQFDCSYCSYRSYCKARTSSAILADRLMGYKENSKEAARLLPGMLSREAY